MNDSSSNNSFGKQRDVPSDIRKLIFKCCDDVLTAEEVLTLQEELRSNSHARKAYLEAVHLHIDLDSHSETIRVCNETFLEFPESEDSQGRSARTNDPRIAGVVSWFSSRYATAIGYAASVLVVGMCLGCGLGIVAASVIYRQPNFRPIPWNRPVANDAIARVVSTHAAKWQDAESPETLPTRSLRIGDQIRLKQGTMGVSYKSGATVVLEGPCVFEVRSHVSGKLYSGKACVSASMDSAGFALETASNIVEISSGQVGVMNDEALGVASSALFGQCRVRSLDHPTGKVGFLQLSEGQVARLNDLGEWQLTSAAALRFKTEVPTSSIDRFEGDTIYLGNLFDDSIGSSLTSSLASDGFQAAAETIDLGVAAVRDGGLDVDFELVDGGVKFNLQNVGGGGPRVRGLPSNDTYRSTHGVSISTTGTPMLSEKDYQGEKNEEGIGMSANEMLTFDLEEIRAAGSLIGLPMRFVADRAGINDFHELTNVKISEARMVVIVSSETEVIATYLNGKEFEFEENASVHSFKLDPENLPARLQRNGTFVKFDVPLPQNARYLTLATVMCNSEHDDHTVFSGARLEIVRDLPSSSSEPSLAAIE